MHAGGADVVAEDAAQLIVADLADIGALAAEAGQPRDRVRRRAAGDFHRRTHRVVEFARALRVDQHHGALGQAHARQELFLAVGEDIDNRVADAADVNVLVRHSNHSMGGLL